MDVSQTTRHLLDTLLSLDPDNLPVAGQEERLVEDTRKLASGLNRFADRLAYHLKQQQQQQNPPPVAEIVAPPATAPNDSSVSVEPNDTNQNPGNLKDDEQAQPQQHQNEEGKEETTSPEQTDQRVDQAQIRRKIQGCWIRKKFDDGRLYYGKIIRIDQNEPDGTIDDDLFFVHYSDGDEEHFNIKELHEGLLVLLDTNTDHGVPMNHAREVLRLILKHSTTLSKDDHNTKRKAKRRKTTRRPRNNTRRSRVPAALVSPPRTVSSAPDMAPSIVSSAPYMAPSTVSSAPDMAPSTVSSAPDMALSAVPSISAAEYTRSFNVHM